MKCPAAHRGFTLVELLTVIAVMAILIGLLVPAVNAILRGSNLSHAAQAVALELETARQTALSRNRSTEVRFYNYSEHANEPSRVHALQTLLVAESGVPGPLGKVQSLPQGIVIDADATYSSILDEVKRKKSDATGAIPSLGNTPCSSFSVRFCPDGSCDLPPTISGISQVWFLTLHAQTTPDGTLPANYATLQIEPTTGSIRTFRP